MLKQWIAALATLGLIAFSMPLETLASNYANADDDVFVDEGDGDFDTTPIPPQAAQKPAAKKTAPKAAPQPAQETAEQPQAAPQGSYAAGEETIIPPPMASAKKQEKEKEKPVLSKPTSAKAEQKKMEPEFKPAQEQPTQAQVPPSVNQEDLFPKNDEQPAPAAKKTAEAGFMPPGKKAARGPASKYAKGAYVTTKGACKMHREPASDSPSMLTVKAAKKIWVEKVDDTWVRGFNKAGEGGYISKDCVE